MNIAIGMALGLLTGFQIALVRIARRCAVACGLSRPRGSSRVCRGLEAEIKTNDMSDWYSVERVGETYAAAKVLIERDTSRILGAHLLGPEASELINFFGLAMRTGLTAPDLKKLVSAYPSAGSDLGYLL